MHGLGYPGNLVYLLTAIGWCFFVGSQTNSKRVWAEDLVYGGVDRSSVLTGPNAKTRSFNGKHSSTERRYGEISTLPNPNST